MTQQLQDNLWDDKKITSLKESRKPIKKFWLHDDIFKSIFFDTFSIIIPTAEEHIIRLIEKVTLQITDERIKKERDLLIEEESAHSKVHNRYNEMLQQEGYRIDQYDNLLLKLHNFIDGYISNESSLALCAAMEHMTSTMGMVAIDQEIMDKGIDERMRKVWLWHFLEEMDHRNAGFDIYKYFKGGYFRRVIVMFFLMSIFFFVEMRIRNGLLYQSGYFFNWKVRKSAWRFLWGKKGVHRQAIKPIMLYFLPGFHPSKIKPKKEFADQIHRYHIEKELMSFFPEA